MDRRLETEKAIDPINRACPVAPEDLSASGGWYWDESCPILKYQFRQTHKFV